MKKLAFLAAVLGLAAPAGADVVIPSSAYASGRNNALFQSDVRILNPTSSPVLVTPIFYDPNTGAPDQKAAITIPARTQVAFDNVLATLFGKPLGSFGPIRFQTTAGIIVSSNVNNTNGCGNGSISGQWLPGVDVGKGQKTGTLVSLASSADAATGFRSNIDFVNVDPSGDANITVKIRKGDGSQLSSATLSPLGPNTLFQKPIDDATFPGVAGTTDRNLWLEFTSDRPVIAFASVISNASGDPFAIVMTPEPSAAPVASFTFSPSAPTTGQAVTFTDSSTGSPTQQLWAFGDGGTETTGTAVTHTFSSAATYKVSHFVASEAGASAATRDVVVTASAGTAPRITPAGITRQQGSPATNSQVATVSDTETSAGSLTVTLVSASAGLTVTNVVNTGGNVTATVSASCTAATGSVTLRVTDGNGLSTDGVVPVTVTNNTAPAVGTYSNTTVSLAGSATVTPTAAPSDNGTVASATVTATGFTGTLAVSSSTGVVTVTNAGPAGTHTVTVTVTDACGATLQRTFTLTVSAAGAPIEVTVNMRQWSFEPASLTFEVGKTYRITFRSLDVAHGIGGLAQLGIIGCNNVAGGASCVANFTPTAQMVRAQPYTMECSQSSCGAGHNQMVAPFTVRNP